MSDVGNPTNEGHTPVADQSIRVAVVDDHEDNIRPLHSSDSTDNAVPLQLFFDLVLSAQPGSVNEDIFFPVVHDLRVNSVSRCSCHIRDNDPVLSQEAVDDRGFAHIRFSHDGDPGPVILLFLRTPLREIP